MEHLDDKTVDPLLLFSEWLKDAERSQPNDPNAAALATANPDGSPSVRMVLIKGVDHQGLRFFTNAGSQKGQQLQSNPRAALCFHWKSLRRQVRSEGAVTMLERSVTEQYFHSRSRGSQIAAAASLQSRPLSSREELDQWVKRIANHLGGAVVPLPEDWCGFRLKPRLIEFWIDGPNRLHNRRQFLAEGAQWSSQLLYPLSLFASPIRIPWTTLSVLSSVSI